MIYPIYVYGNQVLRQVAKDIDKNFPELDKLIANMFDTLYKADGLGLAAPQIGQSIRLIVIDGEPLAKDNPEMANFKKVLINAHVIERSGEKMLMGEGCLSLPGLHEEVERESVVRIEYYDENWQHHDEVYKGYNARVILHEYDHLDGTLFVDRLSPLRRRLLKGKLTAISNGKFDADYRTVLPSSR